ncbi:MAG TPA: response regulator [Syntrophorhabdaceae bacterium]|nr:response regulator [Syntrophorhabdaceae bacterium]HQM80085.1 response regulator [Syntrophorhabdaceae bacterium]
MDKHPEDICVNKHVLVVDDEEQNRYLLESILKDEECKVICAENGLDALERLKKDRFHLIISDILMPKMDGFHLCRECKNDIRYKYIPFVFCTAAYTDKKDEEFALSLGADRFIQKPIEPVSFMTVLREVLHEYEGGAPSKMQTLKEEVPYLREYNERIIQKLEQKVTELDAAYKLLAESEQKYRSIFENSIEGIYRTTPEGKILMANPAFINMLGYNSYEEIVASVNDITYQLYVNPEDRKLLLQMLEKQGIVKAYETQFYKKDRSIIWVSLNLRSVCGRDGNFLYYEGIDEDITTRKLAEEELQKTMEKLRKTLSGTIKAITIIVETRDPYTAGHQRRVANLSRDIAREMGLKGDAIENIFMAGVIHDIGKISIPADILSKPGRLTDVEFGLIKVHPQSGYDILKNAELPYPVAEIVYQHHERIDGSGYPLGLKNGMVLPESRIVSVADVVEAMASHRPYRPALGFNAAINEILSNADSLYDRAVVEACVRVLGEKGFGFE